MARHVIVGAGPVGTAAAEHLRAAGHDVRVITRSGQGPAFAERVAADAADAERLTELTEGAAALYNCANPLYHRWPFDWPPLADALLTAAERTGAVLVAMGNLYGYGPVDSPMTEATPLAPSTVKGGVRARMWERMLAAHRAGRVRVTEARASDYLGPNGKSLFTDMIAPPVRAGKSATVPANVDLPHSLSYTVDAGRTLAVLGTDERAWGRAWHVPTPPAQTLREVARTYAKLVGAPEPKLRRLPNLALRAGGLFMSTAREFVEMRYQFERPFVLDSTLTEQTFGLAPTSTEDVLRAMV